MWITDCAFRLHKWKGSSGFNRLMSSWCSDDGHPPWSATGFVSRHRLRWVCIPNRPVCSHRRYRTGVPALLLLWKKEVERIIREETILRDTICKVYSDFILFIYILRALTLRNGCSFLFMPPLLGWPTTKTFCLWLFALHRVLLFFKIFFFFTYLHAYVTN